MRKATMFTGPALILAVGGALLLPQLTKPSSETAVPTPIRLTMAGGEIDGSAMVELDPLAVIPNPRRFDDDTRRSSGSWEPAADGRFLGSVDDGPNEDLGPPTPDRATDTIPIDVDPVDEDTEDTDTEDTDNTVTTEGNPVVDPDDDGGSDDDDGSNDESEDDDDAPEQDD